MVLDFSSLKNSILSLEKAIKRSQKDPKDEEVRDAVIQRFEYTFELSWKMLRRKLKSDYPSSLEIEALDYKDLIREGAKNGYIEDPQSWFEYRNARNKTSHNYQESVAKEVYSAALKFFPDASFLLSALESKNK